MLPVTDCLGIILIITMVKLTAMMSSPWYQLSGVNRLLNGMIKRCNTLYIGTRSLLQRAIRKPNEMILSIHAFVNSAIRNDGINKNKKKLTSIWIFSENIKVTEIAEMLQQVEITNLLSIFILPRSVDLKFELSESVQLQCAQLYHIYRGQMKCDFAQTRLTEDSERIRTL